MPKIRDYACDCGARFEYMHMSEEDVAPCPTCGKGMTPSEEILGGRACKVIVPMSMTSLKNKAGYVHTHGDRPAEKGSVSVPRDKGGF